MMGLAHRVKLEVNGIRNKEVLGVEDVDDG